MKKDLSPIPGQSPRARKKKVSTAPRTKARVIESYEELRAVVPKPPEEAFAVMPDMELTSKLVPAMNQVATTANLEYLLKLANISVRVNMMTKETEIVLPGGVTTSPTLAMSCITDLLAWARIRNTSAGLECMRALAHTNRYHPAEEWITSVPWDGRDHFTTLMNALPVEDRASAKVYFWRWFVQAIEAARGWHSPRGTIKDLVIVLVGKQGLRKTTFISLLAPGRLVKTGSSLSLGGFNDSDSIHQNTTHWIVELGELEVTFGRTVQGFLKNFLSRAHDSYRRPYERTGVEWPRNTVYAGSVNLGEFLHDATGNRRWGPIVVKGMLPNPNNIVDMQQLYAQANAAWEAGERWSLTAEEDKLREDNSEDFVQSDEIEDCLSEYFIDKMTTVPKSLWLPLTFTNIAQVCKFRPLNSNVHKVSIWLEKQGIKRQSQVTKRGISRRKCWVLPLSTSDDAQATGEDTRTKRGVLL